MRGRSADHAGAALVEVLAALAIGCVVLTASAGIGYHMLRTWERDTARAAAQRTFLTAMETITNSIHAGQEIKVEGGRLVVEKAGGDPVTFYREGDQLKAQRSDTVVTLARGVSDFQVSSTGSGVHIRIKVGTGSKAQEFEIRTDLPPWREDWEGIET